MRGATGDSKTKPYTSTFSWQGGVPLSTNRTVPLGVEPLLN